MARRKAGDEGAGGDTHADRARELDGAGRGDAAPGNGGSRLAPVPADDDARLDGLLPLGISPLASRGVGRPKGAQNKRSKTVADYVVKRFGDPLEAAASVAGRPLADLVEDLRKIASDKGTKLGATVMDIARWQQEIRRDMLPYIHAKRAPVGADGEPVEPPTFHFHNWPQPAGYQEGAKPRSVEDIVDVTLHEENQGLSDDGEG